MRVAAGLIGLASVQLSQVSPHPQVRASVVIPHVPGVVIVDVGSGDDLAHAIAVQDDGKIVVAGKNRETGAALERTNFAAVRLNGDGTIDTGFGAGGKTLVPVGTPSGDDPAAGAQDVLVMADGTIVMGGTAWCARGRGSGGTCATPTKWDQVGVGLTVNGQPDHAFGPGGVRTTSSDPGEAYGPQASVSDFGLGLAATRDGPLLGGFSLDPGQTGDRDTTISCLFEGCAFGGGDFEGCSLFVADLSGDHGDPAQDGPDEIGTMIPDGNGFLAVGGDGAFYEVDRFRSSVNCASTSANPLDAPYVGGDLVPGSVQHAYGAVVLGGGTYLVSGSSGDAEKPSVRDFSLTRFVTRQGQPGGDVCDGLPTCLQVDPEFRAIPGDPSSAVRHTPFFVGETGPWDAVPYGMVRQPDGDVVLAGAALLPHDLSRPGTPKDFHHDFALARYDTEGRLDPFFGDLATVRTDVTGSGGEDQIRDVAIQPDAPGSTEPKIVVAGFVDVDDSQSATSYRFAIARYDLDGTLDETFGRPAACPGFEGDPRRQVVGTPDADVLAGTARDEIVCGLGGDDRVSGGGGDDELSGGGGNDRLEGMAGDDELLGGMGSDTAVFSTATGPLTINLAARTASGLGADTLRLIENVTAGPKADAITGNAGRNVLDAQGGADVVRAGGGDDALLGGTGQDELFGQGGDDTFDGGPGSDVCIQGAGTGSESSCERP